MIFKTKNKNKNKNKKNILGIISNTFAVLFSIQILLILFLLLWYFNNPIKNIYSPERIIKILNTKTKNLVGFEVKNIGKYIEVYFKGTYYTIFKPEIKKIDIKISQKNLLELEFQRQNRSKNHGNDDELKKKLSKYVNGSLIYNGKKIPIKLRVKGDRKIHFDNVKTTSYKIDVRKNEKFLGLEEFSLQKPVIRNYAYEYIFHKLHHELGNISLQYKVVDLSINGLSHGIYTIEEGFSKELIERHSKRNGPIYGIRDDISRLYPNVIYDSYSKNYWINNNKDLLNSGYAILNLIKEKNEQAVKFIDWEAWGKFFAVTDLVEAYHGALAKSVRVYYNPVSGKIEPISFDGHHGTADFSNFIILDFLNENSSCLWICEEREWFLRFLLNENNNLREEFLNSYLKYLKKITSNDFLNNFEKKYYNEIKNLNKYFYSDFSRNDNIFWKGIFPYVYKDKYLKNRADIIRKKLNSSNISNLIFSKSGSNLEIKFSNKNLPFKIKSNCENEIDKVNIWLYKSSNIKWPINCEELIVETINKKLNKVKLYKNPSLNKSLPTNLENFRPINELIEGKFIGNTFYPKNNKIIINQNMSLPKNINLILKSDQHIILQNGSTLVLFGNLNVIAENKNPATLEGKEPKFGSVISISNNIDIKNLNIKNLVAPSINGYDLYAGINIYNSKVNLENVKFENSLSEDTINLIDSNSNITNVTFENSKSDALDIDGGVLNIFDIYCLNIGNDCLDFSNANINGQNIFTNTVLDKSISIGEKSKVNLSNINITNSEIGLAVKDNSNAILSFVKIRNSELPIAVFVKKNEYGPAKLNIKEFSIKESEKLYLVDDRSELVINGENFKGTEPGSVIESYLYGNKYGKATIR
tara:strand:+ start:13 stop:2622 length:2610 start_codon:yes stop_codon:yes gene_type:complete